jgi:hypothetical protein
VAECRTEVLSGRESPARHIPLGALPGPVAFRGESHDT